MITRIGFGYDVHAFAPDRPLILGGTNIPFELGLAGHSDADALTHAVIDALLGAAALGDIGAYYPSGETRWKDKPGSLFLKAVFETVCREHGWRIGNIDTTIVAERPRMSIHVPAMRSFLAEQLHLSLDHISVKATTTDHLGFTGREEGIACYAVVLLEKP